MEITLANDGRLHLLMYSEGLASDEAIRRLMMTYDWAIEHVELLTLTVPEREVDVDRLPMLHLFTNEPKYAADFVFAKPEDERRMQLHLLQAVTVTGQATCVHARIS